MEYKMSSKNSASAFCLGVGLPLLGIGLYFVIWSAFNLQFDEYTAFGILMIIIGAVLLFGIKINQKNDSFISPYCSIHSDVESAGKCAGCRKSFCADCLSDVGCFKYCPDCYDDAQAKERDRIKEEEEFVSKIPLKSKTIAILLCLFLWPFGLHMFYLGYSTKGIARLVITLLAVGSLIVPPGIVILPAVLFLKAIHAVFDLFSIAGDMRDAYGRKLI